MIQRRERGFFLVTGRTDRQRLGAMELLGTIGFSLFLCWFLSTAFWFLANPPADVVIDGQLLAQ